MIIKIYHKVFPIFVEKSGLGAIGFANISDPNNFARIQLAIVEV